jgi:prevent-host-death family protein
MKRLNALELRQSLGKILRALERDGAPVFIERRGEAAAVLISLKDYRERFVDRAADEERRAVVSRIRELQFELPAKKTTLDLLRDLRS